MLYKLLLMLVASSSMIFANQDGIPLDDFDLANYRISIPSELVFKQNISHDIELICDNNGFLIKNGEDFKRIEPCNTDKLFRDLGLKDTIKYAFQGRFKVIGIENGNYKIDALMGLKGGGVFGANFGFWFGKFIVHFLSHGAIAIISAFTGPASYVTALSLEGTFITGIETASNVSAVACGIFFGTLTGPV